MAALRTAGVLCLVSVSVVVGLRLLRLAWRTRQAPELAIGLTMLLFGGVGCLLLFASAHLAAELGAAVGLVAGLGVLALNAGALALWFFTWRVFRPDRLWAAGLFALALTAAAVGYLDEAFTAGFSARRFGGLGYWSGFAARSLCFAWAALESYRYYGLMRRRARLGLAEPLLANRFLMWGHAAALVFLVFARVLWNVLGGSAASTSARVFGGSTPLVISALGLLAVFALWLAFFPPAPYRRWIEGTPLPPAARRAEL